MNKFGGGVVSFKRNDGLVELTHSPSFLPVNALCELHLFIVLPLLFHSS